jgi:hypothetical protein
MNKGGWDVLYALHLNGEQSLSALRFFYPSFVERDGSIFLKEVLSDIDYESVTTRVKGKTELEEAINCVDFTDILEWDLSAEELHQFVVQVAEIWEIKLKKEYPNRVFLFHVVDFNSDGAWGIVFSETRSVAA